MKYEKRSNYAVRISIEDQATLEKWCVINNYEKAWAVRRAIKDFIKNYVETGITPPTDSVNPGAAAKKIYDNNV